MRKDFSHVASLSISHLAQGGGPFVKRRGVAKRPDKRIIKGDVLLKEFRVVALVEAKRGGCVHNKAKERQNDKTLP